MRVLVCLLPVLPYAFNVHIRWLYAPIKGLKADLYFFFFLRCDSPMRDGLRRIRDVANTSQDVANTSQDVANLRKTHFSMCVRWFE